MADKSFEELLAELEGIEEVDPVATPASQEKENQVFKQVRDAAKRFEKENRGLREKLTKYETAVLASAGLTERQAQVFFKEYGETTPENIDAFKSDILGVKKEAPAPEPAPEIPAEPKGGSFAPSAPQGGQGPSIRRFTSAEWVALSKTDTALAQKVFQEGRVDLD